MTQKELNIQRLLKEAGERSMLAQTRRHFLKESGTGLGALAMGALLGSCGSRSPSYPPVVFDPARPLLPRPPHFPGKAKSVIFLHMAGAPSQLELSGEINIYRIIQGNKCLQRRIGTYASR